MRGVSLSVWLLVAGLLMACNQTGDGDNNTQNMSDLTAAVVPLTGIEPVEGAASGRFLRFEVTPQNPIPRVRLEVDHPEGIQQIYIALSPDTESLDSEFAFALCDPGCPSGAIDAWVSGLNPGDLGILNPGDPALGESGDLVLGEPFTDVVASLLVDAGAGLELVDQTTFDWAPLSIGGLAAEWALDGLLVSWQTHPEIDRYNVYVMRNEPMTGPLSLSLPERRARRIDQRMGVTDNSVNLGNLALAAPSPSAWLFWVTGLNSQGEVAFSEFQAIPENPGMASAYFSADLCWTPPGFLVAGSNTQWPLNVNDLGGRRIVSTSNTDAGLGLNISTDTEGDYAIEFNNPVADTYGPFYINADNRAGSVQALGPITLRVLQENPEQGLTAENFSAAANEYVPLAGDGCGVVSRFASAETDFVTPRTIVSNDQGIHIAHDSFDFARISKVKDGAFWDPGSDRLGFYQRQDPNGTSLPGLVALADGGLLALITVQDSNETAEVRYLQEDGRTTVDDVVVDLGNNSEFAKTIEFPTGAMVLSPDEKALFISGIDTGQGILQAINLEDGPAYSGSFGRDSTTSSSEDFPLADKLLFSQGELFLLARNAKEETEEGVLDVFRVPVTGDRAGQRDPDYGENGRFVIASEDVPGLTEGVQFLDAMVDEAGRLILLLSDETTLDGLVVAAFDPALGALDTEFGESGVVLVDNLAAVTDASGVGYRRDLAVDSNGDIYLLGFYNPVERMEIRRFNGQGEADPNWGDGGVLRPLGELSQAFPIGMVSVDDQLYVLTYALSGPDLALVRLNNEGAPDHQGDRSAVTNFGSIYGDKAAALDWDDGAGLRYLVTEYEEPGGVRANLWQLQKSGGETLLTPAERPWDNFNSDEAYSFNFRPFGVFAQGGVFDLVGDRQSRDWAQMVLEDNVEVFTRLETLDNPQIWGWNPDLPDIGHHLSSVSYATPTRAVYSGWQSDGGGPDLGENQFALAVMENDNPERLTYAQSEGYQLPAGTEHSRAIAAFTAEREGDDILNADFVVALVHSFARDGSELTNQRTELLRFVRPNNEEVWSFEGTERLPELDGETPLDLAPLPVGNDIIVVSESGDQVIARRFDLADTVDNGPDASPVLEPPLAQWALSAGESFGLQLTDISGLALSVEAGTGTVLLGGGTLAGQPVLAQLRPDTGEPINLWKGGMLTRSEYATVVDVRAEPVVMGEGTAAHLSVLLDTYHEGRWQARLVRLPFISPDYDTPLMLDGPTPQ